MLGVFALFSTRTRRSVNEIYIYSVRYRSLEISAKQVSKHENALVNSTFWLLLKIALRIIFIENSWRKMLKNGRHLHSLRIIKKINMLNSKSLILKLACRQKSTANRFVLISKESIYFMGSFAFPLIWFSCIFSVWTKCYFQGNTCSFSCLVVTVYMCLNKRFDNTSELCKSRKKPNPLPQLFLLERKKKWKRHRKIPG